jgi:hypothetical protein
MLSRLGSNQDFLESKSSVLPVTPRDNFGGAKVIKESFLTNENMRSSSFQKHGVKEV